MHDATRSLTPNQMDILSDWACLCKELISTPGQQLSACTSARRLYVLTRARVLLLSSFPSAPPFVLSFSCEPLTQKREMIPERDAVGIAREMRVEEGGVYVVEVPPPPSGPSRFFSHIPGGREVGAAVLGLSVS